MLGPVGVGVIQSVTLGAEALQAREAMGGYAKDLTDAAVVWGGKKKKKRTRRRGFCYGLSTARLPSDKNTRKSLKRF